MIHDKAVTTKKGNKMTKHYIRGGKIWISYYVDGARYRKSTGLENTPKNIKIVTDKIIPDLNIKIATGEIYKKKPKTFKYYAGIFMEQIKNNSNAKQRKFYHDELVKVFGDKNIDTISRLDIKNYLGSISIKTKYPYRTVLIGTFECAVDDGVIETNPSLNIKVSSSNRVVEYYTKDEVEKLLSAADQRFRVYLLIAFNTGMRIGEILGLQIGDFSDNHINVRRSRGINGLTQGKNEYANRSVPYPSYILDEVKKIQTNNIFIFDKWDISNKIAYHWRKTVKKAGVKHLRLYCTRHTFATTVLKDNLLSINELAGVLGHNSAKTTLDKYASVINPKELKIGDNNGLFWHNTDTVKKQA